IHDRENTKHLGQSHNPHQVYGHHLAHEGGRRDKCHPSIHPELNPQTLRHWHCNSPACLTCDGFLTTNSRLILLARLPGSDYLSNYLITYQIPQRILPAPPPLPVPPVPQQILAPNLITIKRPIISWSVFAVTVAGSVVVPVAECVFAVGAAFLCGQPAGGQHQ